MLALCAPGGAQDAERTDLQAGLDVEVSFEPAQGIVPGEPFAITARFSSAAGSAPPVGLDVSAWLRPVSASNLDCRDAARSYRSTLSLPTGAIDLNGLLLVTAMADGSVVFADPAINLATANVVAAAKLPWLPDRLLADARGGRVIAVSTVEGEVATVDAFSGRADLLASGLAQPQAAAVAADGAVWVLESGNGRLSRIDPQGDIDARATGLTAFAATPDGAVGARADATGAALFDLVTGAVTADFPALAPGPVIALLPLDDASGVAGVALRRDESIELRYLDAPGDGFAIPLAGAATRLAAAPGGAFSLPITPPQARCRSSTSRAGVWCRPLPQMSP